MSENNQPKFFSGSLVLFYYVCLKSFVFENATLNLGALSMSFISIFSGNLYTTVRQPDPSFGPSLPVLPSLTLDVHSKPPGLLNAPALHYHHT